MDKRLLILIFTGIILLYGCATPTSIKFNYTISSTNDTSMLHKESLNNLEIEGNTIIIKQVFQTPNPCTGLEYDVFKEDSTVNILPSVIPTEGSGGCVQTVGIELREIKLILSKGEYTIFIYDLRHSILLNQTIEIK